MVTREGATCKKQADGWFPIWLPDGMRIKEFAATARTNGKLVLEVVSDALDESGEQATVAVVDIGEDELHVVTGGFPDDDLRTVDNGRFRYSIAARGEGHCRVTGLRVTLSEG